jgi:hypothetical protein
MRFVSFLLVVEHQTEWFKDSDQARGFDCGNFLHRSAAN